LFDSIGFESVGAHHTWSVVDMEVSCRLVLSSWLHRDSALSPLLEPAFRALWIASVVSNIGTWMQNVGVAWLMTSLTPSPLLVALIQTATSLPVLLVGLPAGAVADLIDRRRLLLVTQTWMLLAAGALGLLTLANLTTPIMLLLLTFALGLGGAANSPAWQAIVPELVPRRKLAAAVALNGAGFNAARAIGPALGGLLVAAAGPGPVFMLNAASFLATIVVIFRWRRPLQPVRSGPAERLDEALVAGLRYARFAPDLRMLLGRSALFVLCASALWALLPVVARQRLGLDSSGYGILLACLGLGAVSGVFWLQQLQARVSLDAIVVGASVVFGLGMVALGWAGSLVFIAIALAATGVAWLMVMSSFNFAAQTAAPKWVTARVIATYLLVSQGGLAAGSLVWGVVADNAGLTTALSLAAAGLVVGLAAAPFWRLQHGERPDLRPSTHMGQPPRSEEIAPGRGPVLVTVEYRIAADNRDEFAHAMQQLRVIRRRDGAARWELFNDPDQPDRFVETFLIGSWAEHQRQHERATMADRVIEERAVSLADGPPVIRHLIATDV
jgi:MFS family permease